MFFQLSKLIATGCFIFGDLFLYNKIKNNSNSLYKINAGKISRNTICFIHALVTLVITGMYQIFNYPFLFSSMTTISSGYFLFDLYYMLLYEHINIQKILYIYHHLASIYILNFGPEYLTYKVLFWAEISNIPTYTVYHLLKTEPSSQRLKTCKFIQKTIYTIVRIPILGYQSYHIYFYINDKRPFFICFPIYLMGIVWTLFIVVNN